MKRALFIGRFQPFHNAHLIDIKKIIKEVDGVIIGIGSTQEKHTLENPFSYNERKQMISLILKNNKIKDYKIYPLIDLHNDKKWVEYIKKKLPKFDIIYSGNSWTLRCFTRFGCNVKKIKLIKGISSTIIRNRMIENKNWQGLVPKEIAEYIIKINGVERLRRIFKITLLKPLNDL